ncbi:hypothetical protein E2C01_032032 [Portunus trituberculatus]|uniref:Uncharacterized protein n=1 Tax=Portunus trituberculatus TaxID=210409 RepID=A0A5B7F1Q1_PORTR|nr:hypothetical protein [Portunus trituberculatus]
MCEIVSNMWIDEDGMVDIASDHSMLVMECLMQVGVKRWDDDVSMYDVENLKKRLVENVQSAAENQIGFVRVGRRTYVSHVGMMKLEREGAKGIE